MRRVAFAVAIAALAFAAAPPAAAAPASIAATASSTPLVILMDVSGSMSETVPASNGSGSVVKLEAAKQALQEPIQNQPPGARVGIWTYPGGASVSGCNAGSWLVNVHESNSTTTVLSSIAGLKADGDTPTGPALRALVDDLQAHGIESANILVVSDGLYGCGADPCEVAQDLVDTGFKLAIQAVGFDISERGRESLTCMANATGGNYFDAGDSEELTDVITELTTPQFTLKLAGAERPIAGKPTTITATLTNTSVFDAHDVKLRLAFSSDQPGLLRPQVIPGTIGLGSLAAGQTATRSWRFVAGQEGQAGKAIYSVSASSIETLPVQTGGSFTTQVPGSEAADAGGILSDLIKNKQSLAILGDSFSSGQGAFEYLPASNGVSADCHRSPDTYLARTFTAAKVRVEILACSGAVSANLLSTQIDGKTGANLADAQLSQLSRLGSIPGAVVMTLGGNDIGFASIAEKCVTPNSSCVTPQSFVDEVLARPTQLTSSLVRAYKNTWTTLNQPSFVEARGGDFAPVIVLAYPQVVRNQPLAACPLNVLGPTGGFDVSEVKFANDLVTKLNNAVESAVSDARAEGFEIYYVNETESAFLLDHTVCAQSNQAWVNAVLLDGTSPKPESMHPSAAGYLGETAAILGWSAAVEREAPTEKAKATPKNSSALLDFLNFGVDSSTAVALDTTGHETKVVHPGQTMTIAASGLSALPASVSLHSTVELLTTVTPDSDGTLEVHLTLPQDVQLGSHDVIVQGWDADGSPVTLVSHIIATPSTPLWVVLVGGLGVLLLIGAVVLTVVGRRRAATASSQT